MRKIKEVLRLRFELQLGQREIARACSISQHGTNLTTRVDGQAVFGLARGGMYDG